MAKHEKRGTCQVCGSLQAINAAGGLAKHGYRVQWNQFNGICLGTDNQPYELAKELLVSLISSLNKQLTVLETKASYTPWSYNYLEFWLKPEISSLDRYIADQTKRALEWSYAPEKLVDAVHQAEVEKAEKEARKAERQAKREAKETKAAALLAKRQQQAKESWDAAPKYLAAGIQLFTTGLGKYTGIGRVDTLEQMTALSHSDLVEKCIAAECGKCWNRCGTKACKCL